jgi:hypothetical protein
MAVPRLSHGLGHVIRCRSALNFEIGESWCGRVARPHLSGRCAPISASPSVCRNVVVHHVTLGGAARARSSGGRCARDRDGSGAALRGPPARKPRSLPSRKREGGCSSSASPGRNSASARTERWRARRRGGTSRTLLHHPATPGGRAPSPRRRRCALPARSAR